MKMTPRRLNKAAAASFDNQRARLKNRLKFLSQYATRFYYGSKETGEKDPRAHPVNLIFQAATTLVPNLVYNDPKVKITTQFLAYRPYAEVMALQVNHLAREINLRHTLRLAITDAIFLYGMLKSGLSPSDELLEIEGVLHDVGQPYSDRVDPDDYVIDLLARQKEEAYFEGNRFRLPKDIVFEYGLYPRDKIDQLNTRLAWPNPSEASMISHGGSEYDVREISDEVFEFVDLVELYIPRENRVVTIPYDRRGSGEGEELRSVDWDGPETGPYDILGFAWVPDNVFPVAPAMVWYDLHMAANRIARKISRQAERQKSVLAYTSNAWEDAADIREADDGETVRVDNIDEIKEIGYGGTDDGAYKYMDWAKTHFSEMAMNVDLLSGMATNEPTATQAEIVQANTTVRLADMQQQVYHFTERALSKQVFYLHTDPLIQQPLVKRTNGVDEQVYYTPEMREGDWLDYNLKVIPFSMARQDPNMKVRRLMDFMGQVIPALASAAQMLGPAFNLEEATALIGREMGIEELDEIINSEYLKTQMSRLQDLLERGVPVDEKVLKLITNPEGAVGSVSPDAVLAGGARPEQPNPMAQRGFNLSDDFERNSARHETEGELQSMMR